MTYRKPWFWLLIVALLFIWATVPQLASASFAQPAGYNVDDLWSAAGVATLTALMYGGLVKDWLKSLMGIDHKFYRPVSNTVAFGISLGLAILGAVALGFTYENAVNGLLVAIVGFTSAIGGYEVARSRSPASEDGET